MKLKTEKQILIFLTLLLVLVFSITVQSQTRLLSENDKAQIITSILSKQNFKDAYPEANPKNTVYILADYVSSKYLPRIKGIKFVLVSKKQINRMKEIGIEYYSFRRFKVVGKTVQVTFTKDYESLAIEYATGTSTPYKCRKVTGRWRINSGDTTEYVSENMK